MKGFMIFLVILLFFGAAYYGFIFIVGKTMQSQPAVNTTETTSSWKSQSEKSNDIQQRQRDLIEDRMRRLRDLKH